MTAAERRSEIPEAAPSSVRLVEEPSPASTVAEWGARWLDWREREGVRSISDDRGRWKTHVEREPWAQKRLAEVTKHDAREWLASLSTRHGANPSHKTHKPLAANTIQNILNLVRRCFEDAIDLGSFRLEENPFAGLKIRRSRKARTTDAWTVVLPGEQEGAMQAVPTPERWIVAVAVGSCMRQGEMWGLRLSDVKTGETDGVITVRFGSGEAGDDPTKSGKIRRIPLFGLAFWAMKLWLSQLSTYAPKNPLGLVFPRPDGRARPKGAPRWFARVEKYLKRPFRWHDMRHTGATSLLAGWWGKPWSLEDVQRLCGHSSVTMTERYAHWLDENRLMLAALDKPEKPEGGWVNGATSGDRTPGLRFTKPSPGPGQTVPPAETQSESPRPTVESAPAENRSAPPVPSSETPAELFARIVRELDARPLEERRRVLVALRGWFVGPEHERKGGM